MAAAEQLAWEAKQKPRAAGAAVLAAFGVVLLGWHPIPDINPLDVPGILVRSVLSGGPVSGLLPGLETALEPGLMADQASSKIARYDYLGEQAGSILALAAGCAVLLAAVAVALGILAGATRARRPELTPAVFYVIVGGAGLIAIANFLFVLGVNSYADEIVRARPTVGGLDDLDAGLATKAGSLLALIGRVMLAGGWILVALNAMRVGLLTRFMGALGIIAGALMILPLGPMPLVIMFWMLSLSMLLAGRWPGGTPPAWATGTAVPWVAPAKRQRGGGGGGTSSASRSKASRAAREPKEPKPEPAGIEHPSSKKRKRKRRG